MQLNNERDLRTAEQALVGTDKVMARLVDRHGPCRMQPWSADPFSALVESIVSQQLSVKAADTLLARVRVLAGRGGRFAPSRLAACEIEQLRGCGLSGVKARAVRELGEKVAQRQLDLKTLRDMDDAAARTLLLALYGVGQWTADMLLMFAFGHGDVLSLGDVGLRRGAQLAYGLEERPSDRVFVGMAECWRPWRSVASWYLWRETEAVPLR